MFRDAVVAVLRHRSEIDVVAVVENGSEALAEIRSSRPDVAVLDIQMAGIDGVSVTRTIVRESLPTRTLLLTGHHDAATVSDALAAGAGGFLAKDAEPEEIGDAVLAIARGETALSATVEQELTRGGGTPARPAGPGLSEREHEVLVRVAQGMAAPEIARELGLGTPTVRTHLQNLYGKLEVSDRAAAVAEAIRRGLL